jgi:hypothetical protein
MEVVIGWMENHGLVTRIESTTRRFEPMFRRKSESDLDDPTGMEPKLSEVLENETEGLAIPRTEIVSVPDGALLKKRTKPECDPC